MPRHAIGDDEVEIPFTHHDIVALSLQVSAWEEPPKKQLALKPADLTARLNKKWLQLYWPDDGKWWPCQVATVDVRKKTVTLIYETGIFECT